MTFAGCDLGIVTAKAVIVEDQEILSAEVLPYKGFPRQAADNVMQLALNKAAVSLDNVKCFLATGLGAKAVGYAGDTVPDTVALHRAIKVLNPEVRTVINVGAHSFMAFNITPDGAIGETAVTDRCAAGTGMVLDLMVRVLEKPLDDLIRGSTTSNHPPFINNQCPIFIESEVISLINDGWDRYDIFAGIAGAVATKIAGLAGRVNIDREVALVGGVAKNSLVVAGVEHKLGCKLALLGGIDPQIIGAFGAALLAGDIRMRSEGR